MTDIVTRLRAGTTDGTSLTWAVTDIHQEAADQIERLRAENEDLKTSVIAFCGPWAARYASEWGLPEGTLHPTHYDILEKCGARMVDFVRGEP